MPPELFDDLLRIIKLHGASPTRQCAQARPRNYIVARRTSDYPNRANGQLVAAEPVDRSLRPSSTYIIVGHIIHREWPHDVVTSGAAAPHRRGSLPGRAETARGFGRGAAAIEPCPQGRPRVFDWQFGRSHETLRLFGRSDGVHRRVVPCRHATMLQCDDNEGETGELNAALQPTAPAHMAVGSELLDAVLIASIECQARRIPKHDDPEQAQDDPEIVRHVVTLPRFASTDDSHKEPAAR